MTTTCRTSSSSPLRADAGAAQAPRTARDNASPRHGKWVMSTSLCRPLTATAAGDPNAPGASPIPSQGDDGANGTTGAHGDRRPGRRTLGRLGNTRLEEGGHMRKDIEFATGDGTTLRGWLF